MPQLKPQCEMIVMVQVPRDGIFVDNWDRWETGLIHPFSPEGAVVFDPFVGSGSTGVAARLEERSFVGVEIDADMARAAEQRIQAVA